MPSPQTRRAWIAAVAFAAMAAHAGTAQTPSGSETPRQFETRAELEMAARVADSLHRTGEAWLLRTRLQKGDFQDGDRIYLSVPGLQMSTAGGGTFAFQDTVMVQPGKMLTIPKLGDVPLEGVLRSELESRLSSFVSQYLRDSTVRATPLVRLSVIGRVNRPGFYHTSADILLSDLIMRAGGPTPDANLENVVVKRGDDVIWNAQDVRTAMSEGLSLDRLHVRAGDQIYVSPARSINWLTVGQYGLQILITLVSLSYAFRKISIH